MRRFQPKSEGPGFRAPEPPLIARAEYTSGAAVDVVVREAQRIAALAPTS